MAWSLVQEAGFCELQPPFRGYSCRAGGCLWLRHVFACFLLCGSGFRLKVWGLAFGVYGLGCAWGDQCIIESTGYAIKPYAANMSYFLTQRA